MSAYWQHYQLSFDPFVSDQSTDAIFFSSRFEQQLDLLIHLAMHEKNIQVVTGLTGIGKSTMMRALHKTLSQAARVCKVYGASAITPGMIQELLARYLGIKIDNKQQISYLPLLQAKIQEMQQYQQDFYFVIDNAHKLPMNSLAFLLELIQWQSESNLAVHVILFGGPQLEASFAALTSTNMGEHLTHTIRLEPLSLEDTKYYIEHRLSLAGWKKEFPFSDGQMAKLMQLTHGIPGRINYLVKQLLTQRLQIKKNHKKKRRLPGIPFYYKYVAISGFLLLSGIALFSAKGYSTTSDGLPVIQSLIIPKEEATHFTATPTSVNTNMSLSKPIFAEAPSSLPNEMRSAPSLPNDTKPEPTLPNGTRLAPSLPNKTEPAPTSLAGETPHDVTEISMTDTQTAIMAGHVSSGQTRTAVQPTRSHHASKDGILSKPQTHYAIQLAGARDLNKLRQSLSSIPLKTKIEYFCTVLNDKPWYVAIYGDYSSRANAVAAIHTLPLILQKEDPWPRSFGSIQAVMKKTT